MGDKDYALGKWVNQFASGNARTITLIVTQDCNLNCGYCYMTGKNLNGRMTYETGVSIVDYVLEAGFTEENVIWEFIGGEPTLEIDLIDQLCDYIKIKMYSTNHKWQHSYMFAISTNGILYGTAPVQKFIAKHKNHLSITISIDGTKEKHDQQRVFKNGSGSYDIVAHNVKQWLEQFPSASTKATFGAEDLLYVKDSIIHLWELGITNVPANVIFEDVWKKGDDKVLEQQLKELADYALETGLWKTHRCHFFSDSQGVPMTTKAMHGRNWCGAGRSMLAFDHQGTMYPCVRFVGYSLNNKPAVKLGNVLDGGLNRDRLRAFQALDPYTQSKPECLECEVASGCAWCQGNNYDMADSETLYQRNTSICNMHRARIRANDYYLARRAEILGERFENRRSQTLFVILADNSVPICGYQNTSGSARMSEETFGKAMEFAAEHFYFPILLQPTDGSWYSLPRGQAGWHAAAAALPSEQRLDIVAYENDVSVAQDAPVAMLVLDTANIHRVAELSSVLVERHHRTMLLLRGIHDLTDDQLTVYEQQLMQIVDLIEQKLRAGIRRSFNVLTDKLWHGEMNNCQAGVKTFAVAPNGLLYICPAFYYADPASAVGSLETGIDELKVARCELDRSSVCSTCEAFHCKRCVFDNQRYTGELNVPAQSQCRTSHIELRCSAELRDRLGESAPEAMARPFSVPSLDPLEKVISRQR